MKYISSIFILVSFSCLGMTQKIQVDGRIYLVDPLMRYPLEHQKISIENRRVTLIKTRRELISSQQ